MKTGVLASQGAFIEHISTLEKLGVEAIPVRLPRQLAGLDGLIIPGGESTTISKLMNDYDLFDTIKELAGDGLPIFGTCAGMILMAKEIPDHTVEPLGLVDITVRRNAFGRQTESFETDLEMPVLGEKPFHAVFIRAPLIEKINGTVEVLARLENGTAVAARQGQFLVSAFHPELTDDLRFHQYFLDIISGEK
ncbi:MAG: pyridoxal 5'-phosphate synthase glutaminase subunit PdxT [Dehalococcoidales bacterium]|nr:pyridoxal 5'-phosphate synthase glutaminase subunit PdxT [Dehalococcoidales bacterium]